MTEASSAGPASTIRGRLVLVPQPLDFGVDAAGPLVDLLGTSVLRRAAGLADWLVEDARSARAFLKRVAAHVELARPVQELNIQELPRAPKGRPSNRLDAAHWPRLLQPLAQGRDLGLLSEAGLVAVADPGREVVAAAHAHGYGVDVLPGASAITLAVAASGLGGQSFAFVGYLPIEANARRQELLALVGRSRELAQTQVLIETPYRNRALRDAMLATLPPSSWLSVSMALTTAQAATRTARVSAWRQAPDTAGFVLSERLPAVFCLAA